MLYAIKRGNAQRPDVLVTPVGEDRGLQFHFANDWNAATHAPLQFTREIEARVLASLVGGVVFFYREV